MPLKRQIVHFCLVRTDMDLMRTKEDIMIRGGVTILDFAVAMTIKDIMFREGVTILELKGGGAVMSKEGTIMTIAVRITDNAVIMVREEIAVIMTKEDIIARGA